MQQESFVQKIKTGDSARKTFVMNLLEAIQTQPLEKIKEIIKRRSIQFLNAGYKALIKALEIGRRDVVNFLLDRKCLVNLDKKSDQPSSTPLHLAVLLGDVTLVEKLLKANASLTVTDETGNTPLHVAFLCKYEEIIDSLLFYVQKKSLYRNMINKEGLTHMHIACTRKNVYVIKRFLNESMLTVITSVKKAKKF